MLAQLSFENLALVRCCKSLQSAAGRERGKREEREKEGEGGEESYGMSLINRCF
jgi:hypothetical protein